jgi:chromosome segregation ATPase
MGLFGRKKIEEAIPERDEEAIPERDEEAILKEELEGEVGKLQSEFREKHKELDDLTQKIETVKKEYDETISNIMSVKKEFNQKKMELDVVQREYKETVERNKKVELVKDTKSIDESNKNKETHSKIKQEIDKISKEYEELKNEHNELKKQIEQEKSSLHSIRKQQIEVEKELDEANSRLYNAKEELEKKDHFEDTSILTPSEKEFITGETNDGKNSAGIIEAASAVVGSLKSKLNMALKELETVQSLLEKEREGHEETKKELEKMKAPTKSVDKS